MIELCPKCKKSLVTQYLTVMPPIEVKRCLCCGANWYRQKEIEKTVEFNPVGWEKS